jgi:predicted transcriptional regulator
MTSRIYVSSTYSDLEAHRKAAIEAIRRFAEEGKKHYVDYEVFDPSALPLEGKALLDACLNQVKDASYFVMVIGWRYGYIPQDEERSIVELEFDAAVEARIPRFCFVIDDQQPVSPRHIETGAGAEKLKRLKAKIESAHLVLRFSTPEDLAQKVVLSLAALNRPLAEATQALAEWEPLTRENRRYREEVSILRESIDLYKSKLERVVPADPIWRTRNFRADSTLCFVLMPFSDLFFLNYEEAIRPALEAAGLRGVHAGEIFGTREIMEDIWESICVARVIVADVTGRNPNVFYELGIAHTLGKECVVLTQNSQDVPFDITARRYIQYDPTKRIALKGRLEKTLKNILI